jgi:hypothetical protein
MSQTPDVADATRAPAPGRSWVRGLSRGLTASVLLGLYALGVLHWLLFFNWGNLALNALDWSKEFSTYRVLQEALATGQVPYHAVNIWHPERTFHGTDRFLGLPETNLSPQILLLPWMEVSTFLLANTLLLYSLGFAGCLLLRRRYQLGLMPFTFLFLLFHFNGCITAHLSAGHSMWNGYFLLPFFCLYLLRWVEEGPTPALQVRLALVLFVMILQGSFHLVFWCWMFLLCFFLFNAAYRRSGLTFFAWNVLLCCFRLLPAAVTFSGQRNQEFVGGYPTATDLLESFVVLRGPNHPRVGMEMGTMGWWEFDLYVGLLGFAALAYFGVSLRFRGGPRLDPYRYPALDGPLLVLTLLSLSYLFAPVPMLPLPLANAERVFTRFITVPFVLTMVLASVRMQRVLEQTRLNAPLGVLLLGGLAETAITLGRHSYVWRIVQHEGEWPPLPERPVELLSRPDPWYVASVQVSAAVSLATLLAALYVLVRRRPAAALPLTQKAGGA